MNVWPAPSARVIVVRLWSVGINVSGLGSCARPRWRSTQPDPHNHSGLGGRSMFQVLKLPFDCQAIFFSPHADFGDPASSSLINVRRQSLSSYRSCRLISAAARQHRPGDAHQLVGQRHDDDVLVRPRQQSARPPPKWRLALDQVRQHGSRAVDQVFCADRNCRAC
jgi:hypothetical protein